MKIRALLAELSAFYHSRRGVGHTTCALRGMGERVESATLKPLMVAATYEHGKQLTRHVGRDACITLGNIENQGLRGQYRPLVWDNHAIATLCHEVESEFARRDRERESMEAYARGLRRSLSIAERDVDEAKMMMRRAQQETAHLREQLADARAELEMAHASAPRY